MSDKTLVERIKPWVIPVMIWTYGAGSSLNLGIILEKEKSERINYHAQLLGIEDTSQIMNTLEKDVNDDDIKDITVIYKDGRKERYLGIQPTFELKK